MNHLEDIEKSPDFLIYSSEDNTIRIRVIMSEQTVWITEQSMAEIFKVTLEIISEYIKAIFDQGELKKSKVFSRQKVHKDLFKPGTVTLELYNLDMIIAVGYRINPYEATRFRQWAESLFTKAIDLAATKKVYYNASGPKEKPQIKKEEIGTEKIDNFSKMLKGLLNVPPPKKDK